MSTATSKEDMAINGGMHDDIGGLSPEDERQQALGRMRTAGSISMSPELFEKLYLSPPNAVKGDLRKTFANPTPMYVEDTIPPFLFRRWLTRKIVLLLDSSLP